MKALAVLAVVAAALAAALLRQHRAAAADEARLALVAAEIAQRPVAVRCQGLLGELLDVGAEAGTVAFDATGLPADETHLTRGVCRSLRRFAAAPARAGLGCVRAAAACPADTFALVQAVHTLAHEAWHLAGVRDEAEAECYALQTTELVARRLGADRATATAVARYAYAHLYPSLPQDYRSDECRPGGRFDLRAGPSSFPRPAYPATVLGMSAIVPETIP